MADSDARDLERSALAGDSEAAKRLDLLKFRSGEYLQTTHLRTSDTDCGLGFVVPRPQLPYTPDPAMKCNECGPLNLLFDLQVPQRPYRLQGYQCVNVDEGCDPDIQTRLVGEEVSAEPPPEVRWVSHEERIEDPSRAEEDLGEDDWERLVRSKFFGLCWLTPESWLPECPQCGARSKLLLLLEPACGVGLSVEEQPNMCGRNLVVSWCPCLDSPHVDSAFH